MAKKINTSRDKKQLLFKLFTLIIVAAFAVFLSRQTPKNYPNRIIDICSKSEDKLSCYDKEIPKLLKNFSMESVFEVAKEVQKNDPSYIYCHVLGHNIAAAETKKDPSKWKEVVARCPAGVCSNGCVHGAFQEKFREEAASENRLSEFKNELTDICETRDNFNPSGLEQGSCYHALGHLFMYITSADVGSATDLCDELALKSDGRDFRPVCYDGAFMQIFQPLEQEDEVLVYGKVPEKEEVKDYCFVFTGEKRYSCWNESWPMTLGNFPTGQEVISFCSRLDTHGQGGCYTDIFYILPIGFEFDFNKMNSFCSDFPITERRDLCYTTFVSRILEIDYGNKKKAVDFCLSAPNEPLRRSCLSGLASYANFVFDPEGPGPMELCNNFPEEFREICAN